MFEIKIERYNGKLAVLVVHLILEWTYARAQSYITYDCMSLLEAPGGQAWSRDKITGNRYQT